MQQYNDMLRHIMWNGETVSNRTGIKTKSVFGYTMRFDLSKGFPAVTTKKLAWKSVVAELLWFLEGSTDERRLAELTYGKPRSELKDKTTIWTANADAQGKALGYRNDDDVKELGPVYGYQWRSFGGKSWAIANDSWDKADTGTDQIKNLINTIKNDPDNRRMILNAWDANQISNMALPPCHVMAQFRVMNGKLHCQMYQRSADSFLGVPFNIASYSLLTHILARECGLEVGDFVHVFGDAHIYENHFEQVQEQLSRQLYDLPTLKIADSFDLMAGLNGKGFWYNAADDFVLENYKHHAPIKAEMAV